VSWHIFVKIKTKTSILLKKKNQENSYE